MINNVCLNIPVSTPLSFDRGGSEAQSEAEFKQLILDRYYPIGTIIICKISIILDIGGTWEQLNSDYYFYAKNIDVLKTNENIITSASVLSTHGNSIIYLPVPTHNHTVSITTGYESSHSHNNVTTNKTGAISNYPDHNIHWQPESYSTANNGRGNLNLLGDYSAHTHQITGTTSSVGSSSGVQLNPSNTTLLIFRRIL